MKNLEKKYYTRKKNNYDKEKNKLIDIRFLIKI